MNYIKHLPAYLLAFLFLFAGINYFFPLVPMPAMTGNQKIFFDLFGPTGYMAVIKVIEIIAGILILLPSKRALAITLLAPISVNISRHRNRFNRPKCHRYLPREREIQSLVLSQ